MPTKVCITLEFDGKYELYFYKTHGPKSNTRFKRAVISIIARIPVTRTCLIILLTCLFSSNLGI